MVERRGLVGLWEISKGEPSGGCAVNARRRRVLAPERASVVVGPQPCLAVRSPRIFPEPAIAGDRAFVGGTAASGDLFGHATARQAVAAVRYGHSPKSCCPFLRPKCPIFHILGARTLNFQTSRCIVAMLCYTIPKRPMESSLNGRPSRLAHRRQTRPNAGLPEGSPLRRSALAENSLG